MFYKKIYQGVGEIPTKSDGRPGVRWRTYTRRCTRHVFYAHVIGRSVIGP